MSRKEKIFKLESKEDFTSYLRLLIEFIYKNLKRHTRYTNEIEELCLAYVKKISPNVKTLKDFDFAELIKDEGYIRSRESIQINYDTYSALHDKVSYPNIRLLNAFGDRSEKGMSYVKFRDMVKKRSKKMESENKKDDLQLDELTEDFKQELNQCTSSRNYEAHLPDTKFIAQKEFRDEQLREYMESSNGNYVVGVNLQKIIINTYEYADIEWLFILYVSMRRNNETFSRLFQRVKKDYSKLIGESMNVQPHRVKSLPFNFMEISFNSMEAHSGKKK